MSIGDVRKCQALRLRKLAFVFILCLCFTGLFQATAVAEMAACDPLGWFPATFGLKDHTVFWYDGYYYLMSIYVPGEDRFAYGRSVDLCHWEELDPLLAQRSPGGWDEALIWAPFVVEDGGVYYLFYTGVRYAYPAWTQSIMLATSTNPADPASWQPQGMIFQPDHAGAIWVDGEWADCRDPMVIKSGAGYSLFYAGSDENGGIVGMATAENLAGPWHDQGAAFTIPEPRMPESPFMLAFEGHYYLFYHDTAPGPAYQGERYRIADTLQGPWSDPRALFPGWAHEIWLGPGGELYISYLTDYTVTIIPLKWNRGFFPPLPVIDQGIQRLFLPLAFR